MPLDTGFIAAGIPAPQIDSPTQTLDAVSRVEQLRQQAALAPLKAQQLQNEVTQGQQQIDLTNRNNADQAMLQQAFHDPKNMSPDENGVMVPDHNKVVAAVQDKISTPSLQALQREYLTTQQGLVQLASSKIKNDTDKFNNIKNLNQMEGEAISGILAARPEQKQDLYTQEIADLKAAGKDVSAYPAVVPSDPELTAQANRVGYKGVLLTQAQKQAQLDKEKEALAKQKAVDLDAATLRLHNEAATDALSLPHPSGPNDQVGKAAYDAWKEDFGNRKDDDGALITHADYKKRFLDSLPYSERALFVTIPNRPLTPEQRAQNQQKNTTEDLTEQQRKEQLARDAETARHNKAEEDVAAERERNQRLQVDPFGIFGGAPGGPVSRNTNGINITDKNGTTHHFTNQSAADTFNKLVQKAEADAAAKAAQKPAGAIQ